MQWIQNTLFFGGMLTLVAYEIGLLCKQKYNYAIVNPLLIAIVLIIAFLKLGKIPYVTYQEGANYITYFLTPTTVCLAIPLYQQLEILKKNALAICLGIISGSVAGMASVLGLAIVFGLNHKEYVTLLPKSITTAIGLGVCEELGGITTIAVALIVLTGVLGNIIAESILDLFHIKSPVAKGVAIGTSAHAMGTAKAIEIGEVEGAMSGLSIAVAGLITVIGAPLFAMLY